MNRKNGYAGKMHNKAGKGGDRMASKGQSTKKSGSKKNMRPYGTYDATQAAGNRRSGRKKS